jgi:hypothetical protein
MLPWRTRTDTCDGSELHLVMDNYATHKQEKAHEWLAARRVTR